MVVDIRVADTLTTVAAAAKGLGVTNLLFRSYNSSNNPTYGEQSASSSSSPSARVRKISSVILPVDVIARPPVKSNSCRAPRRSLLRRKQRTKRRLSGDDSKGVGGEGFYFGDGGDGPFGGGGGGFGGSGGSWNYNRFGEGQSWDESSSSSSDPAFDFVYRMLSWIMLWNCLHFSFKKIVRLIAAYGIVGTGGGKVPRKLAPICC